jgi:UDPglucose 6-dehydrogenase
MRISIVGTGYVGLVSGVCLAEKGHQVVCVDVDERKVDTINRGEPPIYEKGLEELLGKNISKNFKATTDIVDAVVASEITLIAVGTPYKGSEIDLSYIQTAAEQIGKALRCKDEYHVVVVKSTVVPGTTDTVVLPAIKKFSGKMPGSDFGVGMNPEFLREGEAIEDFMYPDRIVLGGMDVKTLNTLDRVYSVFHNVEIVRTNNKTAEMIKYTANSLLATMISFSNEIGNLCASLGGIDVVDVMKGVNLDKRISPLLPDGSRVVPGITTYLAAGCGFGGSCFPKDVKALIAHGKKAGNSMQILDSVIRVNEHQPNRVIEILNKYFPELKDKSIAVLGLAFKPGTDDMRESPAIPIVSRLLSEGARVKAFDPVAKEEAQKIFGNHRIYYPDSLAETVKEVVAILLLTRWDEFSGVPELISDSDPQPVLIDGRRFFSKENFSIYDGIGM